MRWKYILAAMIGAFLGFTAQLVADQAHIPAVFVNSALPGEFADEPHPYTWAYQADGRYLGTPYSTLDRKLAYPGLPKDVPTSMKVPTSKKGEWLALYYQLRLLDWLRERAEDALRCASIGAALSGFSLFAVDHFRATRKTRSAASAS